MGVEAVLVCLLGLVTLWLAVDALRERHRLRARIQRIPGPRVPEGRHRSCKKLGQMCPADLRRRLDAAEGWRYWPMTTSMSEDSSIGPRL